MKTSILFYAILFVRNNNTLRQFLSMQWHCSKEIRPGEKPQADHTAFKLIWKRQPETHLLVVYIFIEYKLIS